MGESKVRVGNMVAPTKPLDVMYSFWGFGILGIRNSYQRYRSRDSVGVLFRD